MEGKEVRFGIFNSALFATITTDASCGAVNSMHDSFTPLGGFVPLFNIQLGEIIFGGVGAGLYGMLVFVVVAVFIAGLMVGRTPEYLGKKIQSFEVKMSMLVLLVLAMDILGFTAWACVSEWGKAGLEQQRARTASAKCSTPTAPPPATTAAPSPASPRAPTGTTRRSASPCLIGRFLMIVPIMAMAGSLAAEETRSRPARHFPGHGRDLHLPADRHGPARRRAELPARAGAGPDRRALPDALRENCSKSPHHQ